MSLPQPTKKMRSIETHHEINGRIYRFRAYDFIREVVKRTEKKIDEIVRSAAKDGMREDNHSQYRRSMKSLPSRRLVRLWNNTQQGYKKSNTAPKGGAYRVRRADTRRSAHGYCNGISVSVCPSLSWNVQVIVHEMAHVAHLAAYNAPEISGKRRPHDFTFNKVMLEMVHVLFGLTKKERNPFTWDYSRGRGYSSDRVWRDVISKRVREGCPKVLRYLTDVTEERQAEIAAKEQREKEKEARREADPVKRFTKAEHALIVLGREVCGDDYLDHSIGGNIEVLWKVDDEDIPRILREKRIDLNTMDDDRRVHLCMVLEELRERGFERVDDWDFSYSYDDDLPPSLRGYSRLKTAYNRLNETISAIERFALNPELEA